jgi:two-component system sensor histidine kinase QseC
MTAPIERQPGFGHAAADDGIASERFAAIGQQLSGVMHDLTSPLTVASGYVQLMAREESEERRQAYLGRVMRQFEEIATMSRELLAFARGESRPLHTSMPLDLLATELEEMLTLELAGQPVRLAVLARTTASPRLAVVSVKRVVSNLARNAAEAVAAEGSIEVSISLCSGALLICCDDTGPGISAELRQQVFGVGFSTRAGRGRGFGLALVQEIAASLGGEVSLTDSQLGGARFEVRLPLGDSSH